MRLCTENYLTIIHYNSCFSVAHHWNEDKQMPEDAAWVWQADAGEELTAKVDLLHNPTEHKERRQRGSFVLNYGGNKSHYSDINVDNEKTWHLGEQRRIVGYEDKKHPASKLSSLNSCYQSLHSFLGYLCSVLSINIKLTSLCDLIGFFFLKPTSE